MRKLAALMVAAVLPVCGASLAENIERLLAQ